MTTNQPIAIGGVGGSGTRVVANILQESGIYLGGDLNRALDNLWFTLLFKLQNILSISDLEFTTRTDILHAAMTSQRSLTISELALVQELAAHDRPIRSTAWLQDRAQSLIAACQTEPSDRRWGWKEPNTHLVIDRLQNTLNNIKYIHVARNGLDMAYSANQNQPVLWGLEVLGKEYENTPRYSLKFWCWAHERILRIGTDMGARFLFVNYDRLCVEPEYEIRKILSFIGSSASDELVSNLTHAIIIPKTTGRYKHQPIQNFDESDVRFVKRLGFEV